MPIYEYRCANGHSFEVSRSMADDPMTECEVCGAAVERVFHPLAVHYKGSGFYTTDYAKEKRRPSPTRTRSKKSGDSDSAKKSDEVRRRRVDEQQVGLGLSCRPSRTSSR